MFFHAYMYGPLQGKLRLYRARDVRSVGKALSSDWEVFASILVKDIGTKLTKGVDLSKYQVKSAEDGGNYEYQYHKNSGRQKLVDDRLFIRRPQRETRQWAPMHLHNRCVTIPLESK